jgi:hypothetical protein
MGGRLRHRELQFQARPGKKVHETLPQQQQQKLVTVVYTHHPSNGGKLKIGVQAGLGKKTRLYLQNDHSKKG